MHPTNNCTTFFQRVMRRRRGKKFNSRLFELLPSTEIFSKRWKKCSFWKRTGNCVPILKYSMLCLWHPKITLYNILYNIIMKYEWNVAMWHVLQWQYGIVFSDIFKIHFLSPRVFLRTRETEDKSRKFIRKTTT